MLKFIRPKNSVFTEPVTWACRAVAWDLQHCHPGGPSALLSRIHYLPPSHVRPHFAEAVLLKLERVSGHLGRSISFLNFIFIFACAWSLLLCGPFSSCGKWTQASVVATRGLSGWGSWALEHRLSSCGTQACGIFPDQGSNLRLLHWQVDSLPLSHEGSPACLTSAQKMPPLGCGPCIKN